MYSDNTFERLLAKAERELDELIDYREALWAVRRFEKKYPEVSEQRHDKRVTETGGAPKSGSAVVLQGSPTDEDNTLVILYALVFLVTEGPPARSVKQLIRGMRANGWEPKVEDSEVLVVEALRCEVNLGDSLLVEREGKWALETWVEARREHPNHRSGETKP